MIKKIRDVTNLHKEDHELRALTFREMIRKFRDVTNLHYEDHEIPVSIIREVGLHFRDVTNYLSRIRDRHASRVKKGENNSLINF